MVKQDYSSNINKFTQDITSIITLHNISKQEFFDDISLIKPKKAKYKWFKVKYSELFDGTYAEYKSKESFLGSYRRNINPKYYNQSQSKNVVKFNQELRFETIYKVKIQEKIAKKFKTTKTTKTVVSTKDIYQEKIGYLGFARFEVSKLNQVWTLNKIVKNSLFSFQEIQFRLKYDLIDELGNVVYPDIWITIRSNVSTSLTLLELYDDAFRKVLELFAKLEQSKLFMRLKKVCTYVFRYGN